MENELSTEKTMTVKEVADALGYKADTIQGKVKELFPEIVKNGVTTYLNQKEVVIIKQNLVPRNLGLKSEVESTLTEIEIQQKIAEGYKLAVELANKYKQRAEVAEQKCIEQQPKVEFAETVTADEKSTFDMAQVAQELKLSYGKNILFRNLRLAQILKIDNTPYQRYVDAGYFKVYPVPTPVGVKLTTKVTQKGVDYIRKVCAENK